MKNIFYALGLMMICCSAWLGAHAQDVQIGRKEGDSPDEKAAISASPAADQIQRFRYSMQSLEQQIKANLMDSYHSNFGNLKRTYDAIKRMDPNFDMSKYEATYQKMLALDRKNNSTEYEEHDRNVAMNTPVTGDYVDEQLKTKNPGSIYYSAKVCQHATNSLFTQTTFKGEEVEVGKLATFEEKNNRAMAHYPRVETKITKMRVKVGTPLGGKFSFDFREDKGPLKDGEPIASYSDGDRYDYNAIIKQPNGNIYVIFIPNVSKEDYKAAHDENAINGYSAVTKLFDYENADVDVLVKDEAGAKSVNLEGAKREAVEKVKKNLMERDNKLKAEYEKAYHSRRFEPEHMKITGELKAMSFGQKCWDETVAPHIYPDAMGLKGGKITKMHCVSDDWEITKNDLGIPLYRSAGFDAVVKLPSGKCYLYLFIFKEDYAGGGTYTKSLKWDWVNASGGYGNLRPVPCENVN